MSWWALNLFSFQFKAILMSSSKEVRKVPRESRKALLWKCKSSSSYSRQNIKMIPENMNKTFAYLFSLSLLMRKNRLDENTRDSLFVCLFVQTWICQILPIDLFIAGWPFDFNLAYRVQFYQPKQCFSTFLIRGTLSLLYNNLAAPMDTIYK